MNYKSSTYNLFVDIAPRTTVVFNSASGAIVKLDNHLVSQLSNSEFIFFDNYPGFEELKKQGLIVPENKDEFNTLLFDREVYTFDQSPQLMGFVVAPTMGCNLNCPYCFEAGVRKNRPMTIETWDRVYGFIINRVKEHPSIKEVDISWFGGEPCLQIDPILTFSRKIIETLRERGIGYQARIVTNGTLLNESVALKLKEASVKKAQITIDGLAENYAKRKGCTEDVFKNVIDNITTASKYLHVNVRLNLDRENIDDTESLLRYLLDEKKLNGVINVTPAPIRPWNDSDNRYYLTGEEYLRFITKLHDIILENNWEGSFAPKRPARRLGPCGSVRNTNCTIGPDGRLYRCEHCLGRYELSIGDVSNGENYNDVNMRFMMCSYSDRCKTCKGFPVCVGGCIASQLLHHIEPEYCNHYEDLLKENVRFAYLSKKKKSNNVSAYEAQLTPWGFDYK